VLGSLAWATQPKEKREKGGPREVLMVGSAKKGSRGRWGDVEACSVEGIKVTHHGSGVSCRRGGPGRASPGPALKGKAFVRGKKTRALVRGVTRELGQTLINR